MGETMSFWEALGVLRQYRVVEIQFDDHVWEWYLNRRSEWEKRKHQILAIQKGWKHASI